MSLKNSARFAGFLYIVASIPGFFALIYVPGKLIVHDDATATAANVAAHQTLFRLGMAADLAGQAVFIFVALALYHLLKGVNARHALSMLILIMVSIPIAFINELNSIATLILASSNGNDFLSAFTQPQRNALSRLFLMLRGGGFEIAGIFWGLWLFPLGLLVYRSGFLPRFLGVLLMIGTFAYLANSFTALVLPQYQDAVSRWMDPLQAVEVIFMLWLLIMGAKPKPLLASASTEV
jgi:Domain of unknown function (DUF4386)